MINQANILLVEDEAINAFYMVSQIEKMGLQVHTTLSRGEDVAAAVENDRPDLILMDINLAGEINGIEVVERINAKYDIPVIFITGYSDTKIMERALRLEPVALLIKPIEMKELKKWIITALNIPSSIPDQRQA